MAVAPDGSWSVVQGKGGAPKHPIYSKLSLLNKEVSSLQLEEVKERLEQVGLTKM